MVNSKYVHRAKAWPLVFRLTFDGKFHNSRTPINMVDEIKLRYVNVTIITNHLKF